MDKCFADNAGKCTALNVKKCKGCNFYKTHEEARISRKTAKKRLKSLDKTARIGIAEKYGVEGIV